jgi:hypothetical protein
VSARDGNGGGGQGAGGDRGGAVSAPRIPAPALGGTPLPVPAGLLAPPPAVVAAIAAAVELCWPRPAPDDAPKHPPRARPEYIWRFSGRWWNKPVAARRDRPWADW